MMKICDITNFFSPKSGGVKTYLTQKRDHINRLPNGHSHVLIIPGERDQEIVNGRSRTIHIAAPLVPWESNYRYISDLAKVADTIAEIQPDVIEIGSPYLMPWAVRKVARHFNIPVVGFFHSNFPDTYIEPILAKCHPVIGKAGRKAAWAYARLVYSWCDAVIATSRHAEECLHSAGVRHTSRIPFGVDHDLFDPDKNTSGVRDELGIPSDSFVILYVGRLSHEKNLESLINAFEILDAEEPRHYALLIVGGGPVQDIIYEKSALNPNIFFPGYKSSSDGLPRYYKSADLFATPSPFETFGLSPLEAISSGLPVVGVRGGAVSEILPPGGHELAEPYNPQSLANAIKTLKNRISPEMKIDVRKYALQNFSWQKTFESIFVLYNQIIEARRK
jgi:alpha-1,6-mannosyltransferase